MTGASSGATGATSGHGEAGRRAARGLDLTIAAAVALLAVAIALRLTQPGPDGPGRLFQVLVGAALLCVAGLLRTRLPAAAGFVTVLASAIAATEIVGALRGLGLVRDSGSDPGALVAAGVALTAAAATAVVYAATPRRRRGGRWERLGVGLVVVAAAATVAAVGWAVLDGAAVAAAGPGAGRPPLRWAGRLALVAVGAGLLVGTLRVTWPGATRAWSAWRVLPPGDPGRGAAGTLLALLADELMPERTAHRRRAAEAERARLAADLHAHVLPDLRRAAALAESSDAPADVRTGVRRALDDVEQLLHGRQSIVLEEFGLVAALEWLAERTEQAAGLRVDLELDGAGIDARDAVRPDVARAAFRIALLALDNAARHARASTATVRLRSEGGTVELSVTDDGEAGARPRMEDRPPEVPGGRGIADMRHEAASSGGTLRVTPPPRMSVTATWPVALAGYSDPVRPRRP